MDWEKPRNTLDRIAKSGREWQKRISQYGAGILANNACRSINNLRLRLWTNSTDLISYMMMKAEPITVYLFLI
jgi:hypothetical protein